MFLIVGLGNPDMKYAKTRHNAGFIVIEALAEKYELTFKNQPKFQSHLAEGTIDEEKCVFAMPMTYMNNSGLAVSRIAQFYKITSEKIIVIQDDIDLPFGKIRVSFNASSGGHNGIKSIISSLGTQGFIRLRIGIRNELIDEKKIPADKFVLQNFSKEEVKNMAEDMNTYIEAVEMILREGYERAMGEFN